MRRLAGGLEQLETLERGLERLRDVRERVRRFHQRTYSAYARAAVRERADALRQAQTAVENAAERLRATRAELEAETRARRARERRSVTQRKPNSTRLSAEEHALISSAAWSSVAEVEALREHAADAVASGRRGARARPTPPAVGASTLEAELITAQAAAAERRERATRRARPRGCARCASAGSARRAEMLAEQLRAGTLSAETWGPLLRDLASDWRDVLHRHRELLRDSQRATAEAERARGDERDAAARVEAVLARKARRASSELEEARAALTAAFADWRAALAELELDDHAAADAHRSSRDAGQPAAPALAAAAERARRTRSPTSARHWRRARRQPWTAVAATEAEIERLAAARDDGPAARRVAARGPRRTALARRCGGWSTSTTSCRRESTRRAWRRRSRRRACSTRG